MVDVILYCSDLDYIFSEIVGEINLGYIYVQLGDMFKVECKKYGLLGVKFVSDLFGYVKIE